jgi:CheY-like chemotaxis protein
MANILLIDPNEVASKAMKGFVARGGHRFACVSTVADAWQFLQHNASVDVAFLELKLSGESGLSLVEQLRTDCLLKLLPVVVYTSAAERESVKRAMELKVQNFLVKPYRDDHVFGEIAKALTNPWRNRHFEEEKSFCTMMGYKPDELHKILRELSATLQSSAPTLIELAQARHSHQAVLHLSDLGNTAEAAGAWGVVELLSSLREKAEAGRWEAFGEQVRAFDFVERLIFQHLDSGYITEGFVTEAERNAEAETKARAHWFDAVAEDRCPVVAAPQIMLAIDALSGCPVIDSVAAAFQMSATGTPSSLAPLMDLAEKDPGLSAHLLAAAGRDRRTNADLDPEPVDNARICVGLLGEIKLASIARGLIAADERSMSVPPCTWSSYWKFQVGVGRMAQYTCRYLEFNSLEPRAYAAGLLHDIGKLILLHLHPIGFQAIVDYAQREAVPLSFAEQKFLGCTTREMAAHFAETHGLLPSYANVMRWVDAPTQAPDDAVLVASVALARELCRQNHVGWSGEQHTGQTRPIAETPGWQVLGQKIFPSFNLEKFEAEAHAECRELKAELQGEMASAV